MDRVGVVVRWSVWERGARGNFCKLTISAVPPRPQYTHACLSSWCGPQFAACWRSCWRHAAGRYVLSFQDGYGMTEMLDGLVMFCSDGIVVF